MSAPRTRASSTLDAPSAPSSPVATAEVWLRRAEGLGHSLSRPLDRALEPMGLRAARLSVLPRAKAPRDDAPCHLLVHAGGRAGADRAIGVLACAREGPDDPVAAEANAARAAAEALGPELGRVVLTPAALLARGGGSWALYPFAPPLEERRGLRWLERQRLREPILRWLASVTARTQGAATADVARAVKDQLAWVVDHAAFSPGLRARAAAALRRLEGGLWSPRQVLSHGDLWLGNVHRPPLAPWTPPDRGPWAPFVLIDWRGSTLTGHPFIDLARAAESLGLPAAQLRQEVARHASLVGCNPEDGLGYVLAAVGAIGQSLGCFDPTKYRAMAERLSALLTA